MLPTFYCGISTRMDCHSQNSRAVCGDVVHTIRIKHPKILSCTPPRSCEHEWKIMSATSLRQRRDGREPGGCLQARPRHIHDEGKGAARQLFGPGRPSSWSARAVWLVQSQRLSVRLLQQR